MAGENEICTNKYKDKNMKKIVLTYGLIGGLITSIWTVAMAFSDEIDFKNGMLYGYASMLVAFTLIFVGVKKYRDDHNKGIITFGEAFKIGVLIAFVASTVYVAVWLVNYYFFIPDFAEKYTAYAASQMKEAGMAQAQIDSKMAEMKQFNEYYKNPIVNALITYTEIFPLGLLISGICALIIKKKQTV